MYDSALNTGAGTPSPRPTPQKERGRPLDFFDWPRLPDELFHRDH
jgi:hypothetical protein